MTATATLRRRRQTTSLAAYTPHEHEELIRLVLQRQRERRLLRKHGGKR
jgi:hypothetical protein